MSDSDGLKTPRTEDHPRGTHPPTGEGTRLRSNILARELGGDLSCPRCHYNLKGLSVRSNCPECGLPVRVALLAVVDPFANELRPITRPSMLAAGLVLWGGAAVLASFAAWGARAIPYLGMTANAANLLGWLQVLVPMFVACSGIGAITLIRPHAGISSRSAQLAALGTFTYIPLFAILWFIFIVGPSGQTLPTWFDTNVAAVASQVCIIIIALCLRPNARLLVARSKLLRAAKVDRQVLLGIAGIACMIMAGDLLAILSKEFATPGPINLAQVGRLIHIVGSVLLSLGLIGVCYDCIRLLPVVLDQPISIERALGTTPMPASQPPASQPPVSSPAITSPPDHPRAE